MRKTLEIYRSIAEQAADSIFVTDKEGRVIYQNPEARHAFGFSDDEISGRFISESIHHHHPDGTEVTREQCNIYRAAAYGETSRDFIWLLYRKDGSSFYASCTSFPIDFENERIGAAFFATDITARKKIEDELLKNSEKLQLATEAAEIGLFDYMPKTGELVWNPISKRNFGLPPDAKITYETFIQGIHPEDRERVIKTLQSVHKKKGDGRYEYEFRSVNPVDGRIRWLSTRGKAFYDKDGNAIRIVGTSIDITDRKLAEIRLREASQHDSLTGLPNRELLFEYAEYLLAHASRINANSAVLFIDLDRFKPINDLYGHEAGDKVLQEIAKRLQSCTRKEDVVSRLGGDEFIIILPRILTDEDPETVAQHILEKLAQPIDLGPLEVTVSASIGISLFKQHANDIASLIRYADLAMYSAKQAGSNNFKIYTPGHGERASDRLQLEIQLKHNLESNGMVLHYQPIIDVASKHLIGAEALIRMPIDGAGKVLHPDEFIPLAESAGLINKLGYWVCEEACRQHREWRNSGLPPFSIAINVSAIEFRQHDFATHLLDVVKQFGMDPHCLQIELTESTVMANVAETIATLYKLRSLGVKVALDDFGTGYSSLSQLRRLPLDKLKIDQSFINDVDNDELSKSISEAIIGLGRIMNLKVVGEGVESFQSMDYLSHQGCDQVQGFLFSEPLPAREFEKWCRQHVAQYH
ncbi:MAG TPA: EAL domain-containing protein [Burkholderiaceae bacterium]|jgi:diguanylate cyclase (GGDEF)-like protein/PAS domain S-box-containing protein